MQPGKGRSAGTTVPVERTRAQIEALLKRYGATGFANGWQKLPDGNQAAVLEFELQDRRFRLPVKLPARDDARIRFTPGGRYRDAKGQQHAWEQSERQAWRNLLDLLIAVLIMVDQEYCTAEQALLTWLVLPDGSTVGEWMGPRLDEVYRRGQVPALLPETGERV